MNCNWFIFRECVSIFGLFLVIMGWDVPGRGWLHLVAEASGSKCMNAASRYRKYTIGYFLSYKHVV